MTLAIANARNAAGIADVPVVGINPDGSVVDAITDSTGNSRLTLTAGASVTTIVTIVNAPTSIVSYAGVQPDDGLSIRTFPSVSEIAKITAAPIPSDPASVFYSASICGGRDARATIQKSVASNVTINSNCYVGNEVPILLLASGREGELVYSSFYRSSNREPNVPTEAWKSVGTVNLSVTSQVPKSSAEAELVMTHFSDDAPVYSRAAPLKSFPTTVLGVPNATEAGFENWERSFLLTHKPPTTAAWGTVVREKVSTGFTEDPAAFLPELTSLSISGTREHPKLAIGAVAPIDGITGAEIVLSDDVNTFGGKTLYFVRMAFATVPAVLDLPTIPAAFAEKIPAQWRSARVTFLRNDTTADAGVFRSVPTVLGQPFGDRLTSHLRFPNNTRLRVTSITRTL